MLKECHADSRQQPIQLSEGAQKLEPCTTNYKKKHFDKHGESYCLKSS